MEDLDPKVRNVFEIVGSYFIDIFYNGNYNLARANVRTGVASNVTDGYRNIIFNYMHGVKQDELFKKVVKGLHQYYRRHNNFESMVLSDFQDRVLSQFIPPEYYRDFTEKHKDNTLREIVIRTVNEFGAIVTGRDILPMIIDDHMNKDNIRVLQDRIVHILMFQRAEYYSKFAQEIYMTNTGRQVDKMIFDKLKEAYITEKRKACDLAADNERSLHLIRQLMIKIKELNAEMSRLRAASMQSASYVSSVQSTRPMSSPPAQSSVQSSVQSVTPSLTSQTTHNRDTFRSRKTPYPSPTRDGDSSSSSSDDGESFQLRRAEFLKRQRAMMGASSPASTSLVSSEQPSVQSISSVPSVPPTPGPSIPSVQSSSYVSGIDDDPWTGPTFTDPWSDPTQSDPTRSEAGTVGISTSPPAALSTLNSLANEDTINSPDNIYV